MHPVSRIDEADLEIGDIGTVVFVYKQQKGYEVEFMTLTGETVAVVSVLPSQVRTIRDREIAHRSCEGDRLIKYTLESIFREYKNAKPNPK